MYMCMFVFSRESWDQYDQLIFDPPGKGDAFWKSSFSQVASNPIGSMGLLYLPTFG